MTSISRTRKLSTGDTRGLFIVVEGLDGAGTTTQAQLISSRFGDLGIPHIMTSEPSNGSLGVVVRQAIRGLVTMSPELLALTFAADRLDHVEDQLSGIMSTLDAGVTVICDRYVVSSLAYQAAQGVDLDWLIALNSRAPDPDITIFIDTSVDNCVARIASRELFRDDIFHREEKLRTIRSWYRKVLLKGGRVGKLITADGNPSVEDVFRQVWGQLSGLVDEHRLASIDASASVRDS